MASRDEEAIAMGEPASAAPAASTLPHFMRQSNVGAPATTGSQDISPKKPKK